MRKIAGFIAVLLLAGCSRSPSPVDSGAAPGSDRPSVQEAAKPAVLPTAAPGFKSARFKTALPGGFDLPFAYHRLNDNRVSSGGRDERRVLAEILDAPVAQARPSLEAALESAGFARSGSTVERGRTKTSFKSSDGTEVVVTFGPKPRKPKAPNATGTVHMVWRPVR